MNRGMIYFITLTFWVIPYNSVMADEVLSWQDCIKEASLNHPDLIAAQDVVKESEASKNITASGLLASNHQ